MVSLYWFARERYSDCEFLQEYGCAKLVTEKDYERKVDEMTDWLKNISREELSIMGKKGMAVIKQKYSKEVVTGQYVELVNSLIENS